MLPKYRAVAADEGNNNNTRTPVVQSLECESAAHYRPSNDERTVRRNHVVVLTTSCCVLALLMLVARRNAGSKYNSSASSNHGNYLDAGMSDQHHKKEDEEPKTVFCFGDSLTYGGVGGGVTGIYPYAKYLEQELALSAPEMTQPKTIVEHLGLSGWTAANMLAHIDDATDGICTIIRNRPQLSLLIILAGTNDIGVMTEEGREASGKIIESIVELHKGAINCAKAVNNNGLHTLAIGIPGSAYQENTRDAAEVASQVNRAMENFAKSDSRISYVAFPFAYHDDDSKWSKDGLHCSEEGYIYLAQALAPHVRQILESLQPT